MASGPAKGAVNDWQPVQASDWQNVDATPTPPADDRNRIQRAFDAATTVTPEQEKGHSYPVNALQHMGAGAMSLATPLVHPLQAIEHAGEALTHPSDTFGATVQSAKEHPWETAGGMIGGGILGESGLAMAKKVGPAIRNAAIGDPNAAALRGLQIGPKSPKTLSTLKSVEGARPYLQGAKSLEDLQAKITPAKNEIWAPYQQAVDAIGDRPVKGPDGMTTVRELEQERLQLSALNRDLKSKIPNPESVQLAQQKGLNQAQLLAKEKAVKMALMPQLESTGINPKAILKAFGQVSDIGGRVSGKSTLIEPPQPSGFGKIANLSLEKPLQAPGKIWEGVKDIAAGRPWWEAKPTDVAIREGFRTGGPKPNLGKFQQPMVKGLLPAPMEDIPLHNPFREPEGLPGVFDASINASRTGAPLTTPEGNPNYGYSDRSPELPATKGINQQGVLRRRSTK